MPLPKWLSNPYLGLLGVVFSGMALLFALYSYFTAQTYRELKYAVAPERSILIDSKKASDFELNYKGNTVSSDVTSAIITVWNDGTEAIRRGDILRPVAITLDRSIPILEAKVLRTSRTETGFAIDPSKLQQGTVRLKWGNLDRKDGAVIQIIYEGGPEAEIRVTGEIEGNRKITEYSLQKPARGPLWWFLGISMGLLIIGNIYRNVRYRKNLYLHLEIINWMCLLTIVFLLFIYPKFMTIKPPVPF
ncbi:hypothetical protein D3OALGA1CA_1293 [Olavius algarvensis associated proteobacterium Delta 3]|nr:hypothetical protein D3OALGB2SA_635 [Olavius algarvensis associated proteobacterium Delta 3]CAB5098778.1 hypothetical protein D3OALGA1CA_1293 [Olavius algarvensis associated proteobacterium Delta 3]